MYNKEEHKKLHKQIYNCKCLPIGKKDSYCEACQKAVIDFMNVYGAGALTRDEYIYDLNKENKELKNDEIALQERLKIKVKEVEKLTLLICTEVKQ